MAWTESGIYAAVLSPNLVAPAVATSIPWTLNTNKFYLTNNSESPDYDALLAASIYATTNEVHDSSGWPAAGVAASGLGATGADIALAMTLGGPTPDKLSYGASNISVASTTLASPGVYGGYFYWAANATKYQYIGIYFGGTGYITTAGTFAVTWSGGVIATISCAA